MPVINQIEQERRERKASKIAQKLFDYGIKSWRVEAGMDQYEWQLAAMAAKVIVPHTDESRALVVVMLRGLEEASWRKEPLYRSFAGCVAALEKRSVRY